MKKLLVTLMALFLLVGCGGTKKPVEREDATAGTVEGNDFNYIYTTELTTLDYLYNNKSSNGDFTNNFIEGLLTQDSHGKLVGGMADTWSHNDDASEWTFHIRDNAVWVTNNQEEYATVNAQDFVDGLRHAADFKSATLSLVLNLIDGLAAYVDGTGKWEDVGIKATDAQTLVYTLTGPCAYFDGMTTYAILYPVNAEFLESKGAGCKLGEPNAEDCGFGALDASSILYNSAYTLANYTAHSVIEFDYNKYYWDIANVHVPHVKLTYNEGTDADFLFKMFVNGEVSAATINQTNPEIWAQAEELYKDNMYISDTTSSTFWGGFNFNRRSYALATDPSKGISPKTETQKADTYAAILNKNFRLAVNAAFSAKAYFEITRSGDLAETAIRNILTSYNFVTLSDGRFYGDVVTEKVKELDPENFGDIDLSDGHDAWYNPELAVKFIQKAQEELGDSVTWPITLDFPVPEASANMVKRAQAEKTAIEVVLGDYVKVNLIMVDNDSYYGLFYDIESGEENAIDFSFGAGWGPDFGDPKTYLDIYAPENGDMLSYHGLNIALENEDESDKTVKETIGLYEFGTLLEEANALTDTDARWTKYAEAEAYLLVNGLIRPYSTNGGSYAISKIQPYSAAYGQYGAASYNQIPLVKYMVVNDEPITTAAHDTAKAEWAKGE